MVSVYIDNIHSRSLPTLRAVYTSQTSLPQYLSMPFRFKKSGFEDAVYDTQPVYVEIPKELDLKCFIKAAIFVAVLVLHDVGFLLLYLEERRDLKWSRTYVVCHFRLGTFNILC